MPVPRRFDRQPPERDLTRINERIRVPEIRLIDETGEQVGIMKTADALKIAQDRDLDLVEVAPEAKPPVCRILDYSKYKYEQAQKQKAARKHQTQINVREIKFRPKIAQHDYDTKKGHVVRFLNGRDKVKVTIMFRGREMAHPERGEQLLNRLADELGELAVVEQRPQQDGRNMVMMLAPSSFAGEDGNAAAAAEKRPRRPSLARPRSKKPRARPSRSRSIPSRSSPHGRTVRRVQVLPVLPAASVSARWSLDFSGRRARRSRSRTTGRGLTVTRAARPGAQCVRPLAIGTGRPLRPSSPSARAVFGPTRTVAVALAGSEHVSLAVRPCSSVRSRGDAATSIVPVGRVVSAYGVVGSGGRLAWPTVSSAPTSAAVRAGDMTRIVRATRRALHPS